MKCIICSDQDAQFESDVKVVCETEWHEILPTGTHVNRKSRKDNEVIWHIGFCNKCGAQNARELILIEKKDWKEEFGSSLFGFVVGLFMIPLITPLMIAFTKEDSIFGEMVRTGFFTYIMMMAVAIFAVLAAVGVIGMLIAQKRLRDLDSSTEILSAKCLEKAIRGQAERIIEVERRKWPTFMQKSKQRTDAEGEAKLTAKAIPLSNFRLPRQRTHPPSNKHQLTDIKWNIEIVTESDIKSDVRFFIKIFIVVVLSMFLCVSLALFDFGDFLSYYFARMGAILIPIFSVITIIELCKDKKIKENAELFKRIIAFSGFLFLLSLVSSVIVFSIGSRKSAEVIELTEAMSNEVVYNSDVPILVFFWSIWA